MRHLHLSLAAVGLGLAAGLATPALAQSGAGASGDQQPLAGLAKQWEAAYNRKDAAGVAALYAADATEVTPGGITQGRDAVQKRLAADLAMGGHDFSISTKSSHVSGNMAWGTGEWSGHYGPQPVHGWWSAVDVRDGGAWKIQALTIVAALPPPGQAASASK